MEQVKIINVSNHKKMTDRHLAQVNFVALISNELWDMYIKKTDISHQNLGRIRFMETSDTFNQMRVTGAKYVRVFGRVSHGYGYEIDQDIENAILYSKGVAK